MIIKNLFTSLFASVFFYPLFILSYWLYSLALKVYTLTQWLFKVVYIEHFCGFKNKDKVVQSINSLGKRPEEISLVLGIDSLTQDKVQNQRQKARQNDPITKKIIEEYLDILNSIEGLRQINIILDSQSAYIAEIIGQIDEKTKQNKDSLCSQIKMRVICSKTAVQQEVQKLTNIGKDKIPLLIVFSEYEQTCSIPVKYLVNAQIAFNSSIFFSTKYDLHRSFWQFSNSKQRNGK